MFSLTTTNADECSYFLFQAVLIPVHCLRSRPQSPSAPDWRSQIEATLQILKSMNTLNSNSTKCSEVILNFCGFNLYDASPEFFTAPMGSLFEPSWDAANWMAECAPMLMNENLWTESFADTGTDFNVFDI